MDDVKKYKAQVILATIALLNVISFNLYNNNTVALIIQIIFGVLLFKGVNLVRIYYILITFIGFIFILFLQIILYKVTPTINIYFTLYLCYCVFSFIMLVFNKDVKEYIKVNKQEKGWVFKQPATIYFNIIIVLIVAYGFYSRGYRELNIHRSAGLMYMDYVNYRTDIQPIQEQFGNLRNIEKVWWKIGIDSMESNKHAINIMELQGYIVLDDIASKELLDTYEWSDKDVELDGENNNNPKYIGKDKKYYSKSPVIDPAVTGFSDFEWKYNEDFSSAFNSEHYEGKAFFDTENKIIFFLGNLTR